MAVEAHRPAFYALAPGGWRDYVTLLHPPYTAWHLSYVVLGAALAPDLDATRLGLTLGAFFLAVGVAAHALDELNGRPLGTRISAGVLVALTAASLAGAVGIGVYASLTMTAWLAPFVAVGAFVTVAYNLELLGGRLHGDLTFAFAWGAFPVLTAYLATAERLGAEAFAGALFAVLLSLAQRRLSTHVRDVRRRVVTVEGRLERADGRVERLTADALIAAEERALRLLAACSVALAVALVLMRVA